jgi:hypothetical protein
MGDVVKLPNGLNWFWKRFVLYAKVGICLALILFLIQTITGGLGATKLVSLGIRAGMLLALVIGGAAAVALAHEIRRARRSKGNRDSWRRQVPW